MKFRFQNSRLVEARGRSCGKMGHFVTSIVQGEKPQHAFFPCGGRDTSVKHARFVEDHHLRASAARGLR